MARGDESPCAVRRPRRRGNEERSLRATRAEAKKGLPDGSFSSEDGVGRRFRSTESASEVVQRTTRELESGLSVSLLRERARALAKMGEHERACQDWSAALEACEALDRASILLARSEARGGAGDWSGSIEDATACLELEPSRAAAYYARASSYNQLGDFARAIDDYQSALQLETPAAAKTLLSRRSVAVGAEAYAAERELELRRTLELERSKQADEARARGVEHRMRREWLAAVEAYDECLAVEPTSFGARFERAFALDALGDLKGAVDDYTAALELEPQHALARYNRGIALDRLGRTDSAIDDFSVAIQVGDDVPGQPLADFYHNRAYCRRKLKDMDGALADYDAALRLDPTHFKSLYNRAFCLDALGRTLEAAESYEAALRLKPNHPPAHYNHGVQLDKLGRSEDALRALDRAVSLAKDDSDCAAAAWYARALVLDKIGRFNAALDSYKQAAVASPANADVHQAHGTALRRSGSHNLAVEAFDRALAVDPDHVAARANRAYSLRKLGSFDRAVADYTLALERSKIDEKHHLKLRLARAYCFAKSERPDLALKDYDIAIRIDPGECLTCLPPGTALLNSNAGNSHAYHNRAVVYHQLGSFDVSQSAVQRKATIYCFACAGS